MSDRRISIMQVTSGLVFGGAERMAVNLANSLPRDRFRAHLCSTRSEGPLAALIRDDVGRLALNRSTRLSELRALFSLREYIRRHDVRILHCHSTTVFLCSLVSLLCPSVEIVWHDHWGEAYPKPRWLYWIGTRRVRAIIAVNDHLASWAKEALGFSEDRVHFVRNFVVTSPTGEKPDLPTSTGYRVVCVTNVRPQKDLVNLVAAIALVAQEFQDIQVLVVGDQKDPAYLEKVEKAIGEHELEDRLLLLGARGDVTDILALSDIGVLSSESEGLPLALLEYGMAGLATVSTRVGQCAEVLGDGRYGLLVPPGDSQALADAIIRLLRSDSEREALGREFQRATIEEWGHDRNIGKFVDIYDSVLKQSPILIN